MLKKIVDRALKRPLYIGSPFIFHLSRDEHEYEKIYGNKNECI